MQGGWIIGVLLFPFSVWVIARQFSEYRNRADCAVHGKEQAVHRVERWKWIGVGLMITSIAVLVVVTLANSSDAVQRAALWLCGAASAVVLVASVAAGWMKGGE